MRTAIAPMMIQHEAGDFWSVRRRRQGAAEHLATERTIRIHLEDDAARSIHSVEVNGKRLKQHPVSDGTIVVRGKSTVQTPLSWKISCASPPAA